MSGRLPRPLGDGLPRRGDILLYAERAGLVVHRVVGPTAGGWRTKGDGRVTFDSRPVALDAVVGRVYAVERRAGRFSLDGTRARIYARGLALCSSVCGGAASVADLGDRALRRLIRSSGRPRPLGRVMALAWQAFVVVLDLALFRLAHRRLDDTETPAATAPDEECRVGRDGALE